MNNTITKEQYKAAADRIRKSRSTDRSADEAICKQWDQQLMAKARVNPTRIRAWYDLPVAAYMWSADGREVEKH